jgi:hypothetical protein
VKRAPEMKKGQLRVDPADGNAYPLDSFLECYGEDEGQRRWATAGQQPAYTGISLRLFLLLCVVSSVSCSTRCLMDVDQTFLSLLMWRCQDFHLLI